MPSNDVINLRVSALALKATPGPADLLVIVDGDDTSMASSGTDKRTTLAGLPVSTATAAALALKAPLDSPTFTGTPAAPTAAAATSTTQVATTAFVRGEIAALALGTASTHAASDFDAAGAAAAVTRSSLGLGNVDNTSDAAKPISTATAAALSTLTSGVGANTAALAAILDADGDITLTAGAGMGDAGAGAMVMIGAGPGHDVCRYFSDGGIVAAVAEAGTFCGAGAAGLAVIDLTAGGVHRTGVAVGVVAGQVITTLSGDVHIAGATPGRVPYFGTAGLVQDSAGLTYTGGVLAVAGTAAIDTTATGDAGYYTGLAISGYGASLTLEDTTGASDPFRLTAAFGQMFFFNATTGVPLASCNNAGNWCFGTGNTEVGTRVLVTALAPTSTVIKARGIAGQEAPLVTLQGISSLPSTRDLGYIDAVFAGGVNTDASYLGDLVLSSSGWNGAHEGLRLRDTGTSCQAILPIASVPDAADDAAAAALTPACPIGGIYRTGSILKIRVS